MVQRGEPCEIMKMRDLMVQCMIGRAEPLELTRRMVQKPILMVQPLFAMSSQVHDAP
jgi:hypothetical protein